MNININKMYGSGFTLIEMIIYIALFSIIMSGLVATAFMLSQSTQSTSGKVVAQEELNFVLKKIDWVLTGSSINSPLSGTSSNLSVNKTGFSSNPITIRLNSTNTTSKFIEIQTGAGNPFYPLTSVNVKVDDLLFQYITPTGSGPAGIKATITINGNPISITKYLRI